MRVADVVMIARQDKMLVGVVEKCEKQSYWIRFRKYNSFVTERINQRKCHLLHRPYLSDSPPGQDSEILEFRRSRGQVQIRTDTSTPRGCTSFIIPHPMDDVILCSSYQYYFKMMDGTIAQDTQTRKPRKCAGPPFYVFASETTSALP